MTALTIDDFNFAKIEAYILARASWQDGHLIWPVDEDERSVRVGCLAFLQQHANGNRLRRARPAYWWYMITKRKIIPDTHIMVSLCEMSNCIDHNEILPKKQNRIFQMEEFEYAQALKRLHKFFSTPDDKGCIRWNGSYHETGYGNYQMFGSSKRNAHCASWMLANKSEIPEGCVIRHACDNRYCVNPAHLSLGTDTENADDRKQHGTQPYGEDCPGASITNEKARQIIDSFGNGKTQKERAKEFDVSKSIISYIDRGISWTHLMNPQELQIRQERNAKWKESMLTESEVQEILASKGQGTQRERAEKFEISLGTVNNIDSGQHKFAQSEARKAELASRTVANQGDKYFEKVIAKIRDKSTEFLGEDNVIHLLWKNDPTTENVSRKQMSYNNDYYYVHTVSFLAHNKRLTPTPGMLTRHKCRYKFCVSPTCLEEGTAANNGQDQVRDGTSQRGEKNCHATLTESQVIFIKQTKGKDTQKVRSVAFGATRSQIAHIDDESAWSYIKAGEPSQETLDKVKAVSDELKARKKRWKRHKISPV